MEVGRSATKQGVGGSNPSGRTKPLRVQHLNGLACEFVATELVSSCCESYRVRIEVILIHKLRSCREQLRVNQWISSRLDCNRLTGNNLAPDASVVQPRRNRAVAKPRGVTPAFGCDAPHPNVGGLQPS